MYVSVCMEGEHGREGVLVVILPIIQMYEMLRSLSEEVRFNQTIS